jgi:hypothetical protein
MGSTWNDRDAAARCRHARGCLSHNVRRDAQRAREASDLLPVVIL